MRKRDAASGDLFDQIPRPAPPVPASMDHRTQVAHLVSHAIDEARRADEGMDRYAVAALISRLTGKECSKSMLDGYTAESRDAFNVPFYLVPALETACGTTALTEWLCGLRGGVLVLGPAAIDAEIGRLQNECESRRDVIRELKELRRRVR